MLTRSFQTAPLAATAVVLTMGGPLAFPAFCLWPLEDLSEAPATAAFIVILPILGALLWLSVAWAAGALMAWLSLCRGEPWRKTAAATLALNVLLLGALFVLLAAAAKGRPLFSA